MHRLTARLLLWAALVGTFAPLTMALSAQLPHACCIRKAHRCHESAGASSEAAFQSSDSEKHSCCRALAVTQWAQPQPAANMNFTPQHHSLAAQKDPYLSGSYLIASRYVRGPPPSLL